MGGQYEATNAAMQTVCCGTLVIAPEVLRSPRSPISWFIVTGITKYVRKMHNRQLSRLWHNRKPPRGFDFLYMSERLCDWQTRVNCLSAGQFGCENPCKGRMRVVECRTMARIRINAERCKGCGLCVGVCPKGHLVMGEELNQAGYTYAKMKDDTRCTACGLCYRMCPDVVIEVEGKE